MKYILKVCALPVATQVIEEKHAQFISAIRDLPPPWGAVAQVPPPPIGANLGVMLGVRKFLGKGLSGDAMYSLRGWDADRAAADDRLHITFNPQKINYVELVEIILPAYVRAFSAYRADIFDEEFIFQDVDEIKRLKIDGRHGRYRVSPASFMNRDFCLRAYGLRVEEVADCLKPCAEEVRVTEEGLYAVLTKTPLPHSEMDVLCQRAKAALEAGRSAG